MPDTPAGGIFWSRDSSVRNNTVPHYAAISSTYTQDERSPLLQSHMDGSDNVAIAHPGLASGKSPGRTLVRLGTIVVIVVFLIEVWSFASLMRLSEDIHAEDRSRQSNREKWAVELERYNQQKAIMDQKWAAELERYSQKKADLDQKWAVELERYNKQKASMDQQWVVELERYNEKKASMDQKWAVELGQYNQKKAIMDQKYAQWDAEEDAHRRQEKAEQERKERELEEIERQRQRLAWVNVVGEQGCIQYNTRAWFGSLANVPRSLDPLEECMMTPLLLNGRKVLPKSCSLEGSCPYRARGMWIDDADESACRPNWGQFYDKGCPAPGLRKYESQLQNLGFWNSWLDVCRTTPGNINGNTYRPNECLDWGGKGKWAIWVVPDRTC